LLNVKQFRYAVDNLGYLVFGHKDALVIDGGAHQAIKNFMEKKKLNLRFLTNTHDHYDHTSGNDYFLKSSDVCLINYERLVREKEISMEGGVLMFV
jgi:hydroxyacylglutathione hydrolase